MRDHFNSVFHFYNNLTQQTKKRYDSINQRKDYEKQRICKLLTRKCQVPLQTLHNIYFVRKIAGRYKNEADFSY